MRLEQIAAVLADRLVGRLLRRALVAAFAVGLGIVALYHFTIAGTVALQGLYGQLGGRLIVGGIYAVLSVISLAVFWGMRAKAEKSAGAPALQNPREMQLVMLVEALMLGYSLARRGQRAR